MNHEAARIEELNASLNHVNTSTEHYTLPMHLTRECCDWLEVAALEIIGEGLDWNRILVAAYSKRLHIEWYFFSFFHCRPMKCYSFGTKVITDTRECKWLKSSLIDKEDETKIKHLKIIFLRVIEECNRKKLIDPAEAIQNGVGYDNTNFVGGFAYCRNGVGILPIHMVIKYSVGGQSGDKEDGQQLTKSEPHKTNVEFASYLCCVEGKSGGCQVAFLLNETEQKRTFQTIQLSSSFSLLNLIRCHW